jgi:peptidoglycan glycosyltransferase
MLSIWQSFQAWLNKLFGARQAATPNSVISNSSMMQNVLDTVLLQARKVINRTVPQLEVIETRFSKTRQKYIKKKEIHKLLAKTYALGRDPEAVIGETITADEAILINPNNQHTSRHHLSIEQKSGTSQRDRYILKNQKTTNGTFKRLPFWMYLKFWEYGSNYQYQATKIPFIYYKCKKLNRDIELKDGDVIIIGEPEALDDKNKSTNPQLRFIYPPVWYVRVAIWAGKGLLGLIIFYLLICWLLMRSVSDVAIEPLPSSPAPLAIYANDNKTVMAGGLATPHQEKNKIKDFPELVVQTVLASEDQLFGIHNGLNPYRIASLALERFIRSDSGGGSTIDQQVARTLFSYDVNGKDMWGKKIEYDPEKGTQNTLDRKIREAGIALRLDRTYSKDDVLLAYLNTVDLGYRDTGESIRGFSDASLFYFNKPIENLSAKDPQDVARVANLVSLLRAPARAKSLCERRIEPSAETDLVRKDARELKDVRDALINLISDRGYITKDVAAIAKKQTNYNLFASQSGFCQGRSASEAYKYSPVFLSERIREEMRIVLSITEDEEKERKREVFDNYIVVSSLDTDKQDNAKRLLTEKLEKLWLDKGVPHGALITINPKNGEVLALVGEVEASKVRYDYAATELIPPASTFKMFFYTAALKGGLPSDRVYDCANLQFEGETFSIGDYSGYCASGNRRISVKEAVAFSDNLLPLRVVKDYASMRDVAELAREMGLTTQLTPPIPRMAFGQYKTILREMTGAYGVLANGGKYNFPHAIREIRWNTNKNNCDSSLQKVKNCPLIYEYKKDVRAEKRVISEQIANQMTELLKAVVSDGTGRNADIRSQIGKTIAGKTGTSDGRQDGWFIGYIPKELVTGVWLGNFVQPALVVSPPPTTDFNSADAAMVWGDYMFLCHQEKGCRKN